MSKKIREYKILCALSLNDLTSVVRDYINNEWEPLGGPFVSQNKLAPGELQHVCQAMVAYYE